MVYKTPGCVHSSFALINLLRHTIFRQTFHKATDFRLSTSPFSKSANLGVGRLRGKLAGKRWDQMCQSFYGDSGFTASPLLSHTVSHGGSLVGFVMEHLVEVFGGLISSDPCCVPSPYKGGMSPLLPDRACQNKGALKSCCFPPTSI